MTMSSIISLYLSRLEMLLGNMAPRLLLHFRRMIGYGVEPELGLLPKLCDKNLISVDIGANAGMYTYHMLKYSMMVYAFEPNPRYTKRLVRCFPSRVVLNTVALSDTTGESELRIPMGINGAGSLQESNDFGGDYSNADIEVIKVPMKRLDDFELKGVGFIKIDVEGYEHSVLNGAVKTIVENKPAMLIEIEERHRSGSVSQVWNFLTAYGYSGFFSQNGKLHPLEQFNIDQHQSVKNIEHVGSLYINNFIFLMQNQIYKVKDILA